MKVSVVMPVYNGEQFLRDAIQSVLSQTFKDLELIIINDGSRDGSEQVIKEFADHRLIYIFNEANIGLVKSLNKGLTIAKGEYIARMDQDDICHPHRLAHQVSFLDLNFNVGACSTGAHVFGDKKIKFYGPHSSQDIAIKLLYNSPIIHPTVMMRKSVLNKFHIEYDFNYSHAEDYELWTRLIMVTPISNLHKLLLNYRWHDTNYSNTKKSEQRSIANEIRVKYLKRQLSISVSNKEASIHKLLCEGIFRYNSAETSEIKQWLLKLFDANLKHKNLDGYLFAKSLSNYWQLVLVGSNSTLNVLRLYHGTKEKNILGNNCFGLYKKLIKKALRRQ